jgi:MFS family permease
MTLHPNLFLLFVAQAIFSSGSVVLVTVGGVVGSRIAHAPELATLPVSLMIVGTACVTVPASLLMERFGRRAGFACASIIAATSALVAAGAASNGLFVVFCLAAVGIGATMAFGQQLRFAAAECVSPERTGQAVSFILLGSIGGALLGGELVARSEGIDPANPFRVAFIGLACAHVIALALIALLRPVAPAAIGAAADDAVRPLKEIVRSPGFALAVTAGVVGQGVMSFLMTATPVSMHVIDGHGLAETAGVVRAHVIAMYAPSLVSGLLISRLGTRRMMAIGAVIMLACVATGFAGHQVMHYGVTLVLLGVGWNFLFVGGTTALVATYRPRERFRAQAVNEFSVFGSAALASLLAGSLVLSFGWERVLLMVLPVLVAMLAFLLMRRRNTAARLV